MSDVDPVLNEIVLSALNMAVEEGGLTAARSAGSPFVSGSNGIACAAFDLEGRQIVQTAGGLLHVSALRVMLGYIQRKFPTTSLVDGDVFILNDHFQGGIHPTDVGIFRPVFHAGRPVFFVAAMMIVSDLGGLSAGGLPANATEIFHEGIVIPPVRYHQAGSPVEAVVDLIRSNSRTAEKVIGDIDALVAGVNVAAARLNDLLDKYGEPRLIDIVANLMRYTETMTRDGIAKIPDGVYSGSYEVEGDGFETDRTFGVRVTVTIDGSDCRMDFGQTDRQARGPINASYSQALSGAVYALRCYLDPNIPMNDGFYAALDVELPLGTLVNPRYPAACNLRMGTVNAMMDAVNAAFAEAYPERVVAPGSIAATANVSPVTIGEGSGWSMLDVHFGVGGGRLGLDGVDGIPSPIYSSSGWDRSIEAYEWEFPMEYECYELLPDSAGPGRWRGGAGVVKRFSFSVDAWLTVRSSDRFARPPRGLVGGQPGRGGAWIVNEGRPDEQRLPSKKTNHFLRAGDTLTFINSGGGGFGNPHERDPEAVRSDVLDRLVTPEGALRDYGVDIDALPHSNRK